MRGVPMTETPIIPPTFRQLDLSAALLQSLDRLGFVIPTPIQVEAIPHGMKGEDVMGIAQTGTGKTLAFGLPVLDKVLRKGQGLVLAPTRELALQIEETLIKVGKPLGLRTAVLIGGAAMSRQVQQIRSNPHVIVATPGRLMDHLHQNTLRLDRVSVAVLDEADRMLDMGFLPAIRRIIAKLPGQRQTMLFSATMPKEIAELTREFMQNPVRVEVARAGTTAEKVEQELHLVPHGDKLEFLEDILRKENGTVLVFARTRHGAKKVAKEVRLMGHSAAELHSDRTLAQRRAALDGFKNGQHRVLVATDIAARGIDVKQISMVVNFDLPDQPEDYIHRIGRTGRAGESGKAVTLATPDQVGDVRRIEKLIGSRLLPNSVRPPEPAIGHGRPHHGRSSTTPMGGPRPANGPRRFSGPRKVRAA